MKHSYILLPAALSLIACGREYDHSYAPETNLSSENATVDQPENEAGSGSISEGVTPVEIESETVTPPAVITGSPADEAKEIPGALPGLTKGRYFIKSAGSKKCLQVVNAERVNNAPLIQKACNESNAQKFDVAQVEPGFYRITNVESGKSLELRDQEKSLGTILQQNDYFGQHYQQFAILSTKERASFRIRARDADVFFDVKSNSHDDDAIIQIWKKANLENQEWYFLPTL